MTKRHVYCLLLLSVITISHTHAEIYRWVDREGVPHYTDDPKEFPDATPVTVNTEKTGAQLSTQEQQAQWHESNLEDQTSSETTTINNQTNKKGYVENTQAFECEDDKRNCFDPKEDQICYLRWGVPCHLVYFSMACRLQECQFETDKCQSAFWLLDSRLTSINSRDVGITFPFKGRVTQQDWMCLQKTGLFCHEYSHEQQCQKQYRNSCDQLTDWVDHAIDHCLDTGLGDCDTLHQILKKRPIDEEERHRTRRPNRDLMFERYDFRMKSAQEDDSRIQSVMSQMPFANPYQQTHRLVCDWELNKWWLDKRLTLEDFE